MKRIDLEQVEHSVKIGDQCPAFEPNVTEDSLFYVDGKLIGFYLKQMPDKMCKLADVANAEFNSKRVPKEGRVGSHRNKRKSDGTLGEAKKWNAQCGRSTIIGGVPPQPHLGRPYVKNSTVHDVKSAQTFIKSMLLLAKESEALILQIMPDQYAQQMEALKDVSKKWKFGNLFTSSISNYNVSASFHKDVKNVPNTVNVIICKRLNSKGGDLHVPDYGATIGQVDNSVLVYPAWRNVHGVTPIEPTHEGGYRNSLVFYPLKAFLTKD